MLKAVQMTSVVLVLSFLLNKMRFSVLNVMKCYQESHVYGNIFTKEDLGLFYVTS